MTQSSLTVPRHRDDLTVERRPRQHLQPAVPIAISDEEEIIRIRRVTSPIRVTERTTAAPTPPAR